VILRFIMAHPVGKKDETRAKVLRGAGRGFRRAGFGGAGVDGLAKEAGVTSGAFYAHFKSKADAFRAAVDAGLRELRQGVVQFRERYGARWRAEFIDFYLGDRRTCDLADSCALQSLSSEVARGDDETRVAYESELRLIISSVADGLHGKPKARRERAAALLALLVGGVTLARAVQDRELGDEIVAAIRKAALQLADV
jgi:AcrR family transcriptional regulator